MPIWPAGGGGFACRDRRPETALLVPARPVMAWRPTSALACRRGRSRAGRAGPLASAVAGFQRPGAGRGRAGSEPARLTPEQNWGSSPGLGMMLRGPGGPHLRLASVSRAPALPALPARSPGLAARAAQSRPADAHGPARIRVFERFVFPRPGPALRASLHSRPTAARAYGMPGRDSRGSRAGSTGTGPGPAGSGSTVWGPRRQPPWPRRQCPRRQPALEPRRCQHGLDSEALARTRPRRRSGRRSRRPGLDRRKP